MRVGDIYPVGEVSVGEEDHAELGDGEHGTNGEAEPTLPRVEVVPGRGQEVQGGEVQEVRCRG